jgi:FkbM family methyltransferase
VINLVVATSCAHVPSLASAIQLFAQAGVLTWLVDGESSVPPMPKNVPLVTHLHQDPKEGSLSILVAPPDVGIAWCREATGVLLVIERTSPQWHDRPGVLVVDDFSKLVLLDDLSRFSGLSRLLQYHGWSEERFREAILSRYADSLDAIRTTRRAAIFGAQRLGELVQDSLKSSGVTVEAFVDNNPNKHGARIRGTSVLPLAALSDKDLPIVIATTRFSNSIAQQLSREGFRHVLPYSVMSLANPELYPDEIPYVGIQKDFATHAEKYLELFLCLSDEKSRRVLDGLISYRLDYDSQFAESVSDEYSRQYFDVDLIKFSGKDVFVDLGAYDGDTAEKFIEFSGNSYSKIYLFEPDENLLKRAASRLQDFNSIEFIQAGAHSSDGELRFAASGRTNGAFSDVGELVVPVRKVDGAVAEVPTLIKMDIEGAEENALRGAADILRTARPRLAIAAYHFAPDLWHLVDVVREINPTYTFYLRHYSETGLESVIYAI